jgi:predicted DNA-binding transcriptional regulator AlpA
MRPDHTDLSRHVKTGVAATMLGVCRETLRGLARDGVLPQPVILSRRVHLWSVDEINRVLAERRRAVA